MVAKAVIIFGDGTTMVFDTFGEQIRQCQGCILDVKIIKNLNKYCDEDTKFYKADWVHKTTKPLDWDLRWWFKEKLAKKKKVIKVERIKY